MTALWYYSNHDQPIGPLTLTELRAALSLMEEPDKALVWHTGLDSWQEAQHVRELSSAVSTTAIPSKTDINVPKRPQRIWGGVLTTTVIVAALTAARHLPASEADANSPISGQTRQAFVKEANASCLRKQESDPANKPLSLSHETLAGYCSCYVNALASLITYADLRKNLHEDGTTPPDLKSKIDKVSPPCWNELQKKLMRGDGNN